MGTARVIPAVLLPFNVDFSIDERSYRKHLSDVTGVDGISRSSG
jgi:4-hydroxy-tetrahydrodipicolinate synthase